MDRRGFVKTVSGVLGGTFGAWDAAGAKWFGYPTVWVNRAGVPREELSKDPDVTTADLSGLIEFAERAE